MIKYLLAGAAALAVATTANAETYAVQAGRLIVDAAQPARGNATVIVENGRVARIEEGFTAPAGATIVDQRSRTVMPGLIDVHVHLTQTSGTPWYAYYTQKYSNAYGTTLGLTHALEMARAGFTTVLWSYDSGDSRTRSPDDVAAAFDEKQASAPGTIALLHEGHGWTMEALPSILEKLRKEGHELVTVGEILHG